MNTLSSTSCYNIHIFQQWWVCTTIPTVNILISEFDRIQIIRQRSFKESLFIIDWLISYFIFHWGYISRQRMSCSQGEQRRSMVRPLKVSVLSSLPRQHGWHLKQWRFLWNKSFTFLYSGHDSKIIHYFIELSCCRKHSWWKTLLQLFMIFIDSKGMLFS